jgi:hypothetical protein
MPLVFGQHPHLVASTHTWSAGLQVADLQSQVVGLSSQLEVRQQRLEAAQTAADLAVEQVSNEGVAIAQHHLAVTFQMCCMLHSRVRVPHACNCTCQRLM